MNYIQKTLKEISQATQIAIFDSEFASKKGFLQKVNPQLKIAGVFSLILCINFTKSIYLLLFFCLLSLFILFISKIPVLFFLKRFLFIPLFSLIIAIPSIFSFITPGSVVFSILGLNITKQGILTAIILVLRVSASVGATILLPITTPWTKLISAFKSFKIPWGAILVLLMGYRYIFSITKMVEDSFMAKLSRQIKPSSTSEYKFLGNKTGLFMQKSINLSENIYLAFLSRGYTDKTSGLFYEKFSLTKENLIWILIVITSVILTWRQFFF